METKKEFRYFTIMEYEKEQLYLQQRHKEGWKFVNVTGLGRYHFEKCEPEDVVYQLDYNQDGRAHKEEYVQMFEDCGWEYIMDFVGYSYFRKPVSEMVEDEGIFCDDDSRLEMMQRVLRGRMLPLAAIFCGCLVPQLVNQLNPDTMYSPAITAVLGAVVGVYIVIFVHFLVKYAEYKKKIGR